MILSWGTCVCLLNSEQQMRMRFYITFVHFWIKVDERYRGRSDGSLYLQVAGRGSSRQLGRRRLTKCILKTFKIQLIIFPPLPPPFRKTNSCSAVKLRLESWDPPAISGQQHGENFFHYFPPFDGDNLPPCPFLLPLPIPFPNFITRFASLDHQ